MVEVPIVFGGTRRYQKLFSYLITRCLYSSDLRCFDLKAGSSKHCEAYGVVGLMRNTSRQLEMTFHERHGSTSFSRSRHGVIVDVLKVPLSPDLLAAAVM